MPAPTATAFKVSFPEFDQVSDTLVDAKIAEAVVLLSEDAFSEALHTLAVSYRAAHLLAISPYGTQLQLSSDDGVTTYSKFFKEYILPRVARRGAVL